MKKILLSLITAFITALGVSAQNTYNMVIEMTDGTKINIGPNDIKNMTFMDGKLTVSGESINDIKKRIAALEKRIDEQENCDCTYEIETLKEKIDAINISDIMSIINVLQMQVTSLTNEIATLKKDSGNSDNQGGGDDNQGDNIDALVGIWIQPFGTTGVIGIKLTKDGKAYYNEWAAGKQPNFDNVVSPANATITATTLRITHPQVPEYFEEYSYVLSDDKKSVTFTLVDWNKDKHNLSGTFTKVE